jgi:thioredoxin-related protein
MKPIKPTHGALAAFMAVAFLTVADAVIVLRASATPPAQSPAASRQKSDAADWRTDFAAAQEQAKAEHKPILLDFTGSDWCGWCMKTDREIFTTPEFRDFATKHLVLVKVDFPRHLAQSDTEKAQNEQLAARFRIQGFPTLVVLSPDGNELGMLGYMPGGPKPFMDELSKMLDS